MQRTPTEIKESIYAACGGDWADTNQRIAELQTKLIQALIWQLCPPADGWQAVGNRQINALTAMSSTPAPSNLFDFGGIDPRQIAKDIAHKCDNHTPWDIDWIDAYINGDMSQYVLK